MNYKKGILSVVLWFIYAMIVGTGMVGTAMAVLLPEGGSRLTGLVIAGVWLAVTGLVVYLLHGLLERICGRENRPGSQAWLIPEGVLFVTLIAAGIALRVREAMLYGMTEGRGTVWFDTVKVTETTQIPRVVHGAVYLYLQVLHGLLIFLGNKISVVLVLQVILQILTGIFLYFAVRKLTGVVAAMFSMGYWMLCPVLSDVVIPGPEPLYLLLWVIGLCTVAGSLEHFQKKGNIPGIRSLIGFFVSGIAVGVAGYLDVMGFLLVLFIFLALFLETSQKTGVLRRISAVLLGMSGTMAGFFLCIALDAVSSNKPMENILLAWWKVCAPERFSLAVTYTASAGAGIDFSVISTVVMVTVFGLGAFSYWCQRSRERQSVWVVVALLLILMICYGMTGEEMPGLSLMALLLSVIAGAGLQAIVPYRYLETQVQTGMKPVEEGETSSVRRRLKVQDLENEDLPEEDTTPPEEEQPKIQLIENPLPLPKKHVPKVLDYKINSDDDGDFDYPVAEDDDFDH